MSGRWWYELDAEDRVADVGPGWDEFAHENTSPNAVRDVVVGRPFYSFVAGSQTRSLLEMIFERTRERSEPIEMTFRCDAPRVRRFMSFTSETTPDGGIRVHTRLLGAGERDALGFLRGPGVGSQEPVRVCSWCNRIAVESGRWLEAETGAERLGLLLRREVPPITHGICPGCKSGVMSQLSREDVA